MPDRERFVKAYAQRIKQAVTREQTANYMRPQRSASSLASGELAAEIKRVAQEIDGLVYEGTKDPISADLKKIIITETAEELGADPEEFQILVRSGSNDMLMNVINYMDKLVRGPGR
jgi:hypothetical protein